MCLKMISIFLLIHPSLWRTSCHWWRRKYFSSYRFDEVIILKTEEPFSVGWPFLDGCYPILHFCCFEIGIQKIFLISISFILFLVHLYKCWKEIWRKIWKISLQNNNNIKKKKKKEQCNGRPSGIFIFIFKQCLPVPLACCDLWYVYPTLKIETTEHFELAWILHSHSEFCKLTCKVQQYLRSSVYWTVWDVLEIHSDVTWVNINSWE